ncbi:MAG: hypothetical protein JWN61_1248 [Pseudonocardiales bacterium]|nr:hypothetical protein [Jatrophihabitantaceae bacterium]MCW2603113.1 hypothetical protein [Pseudonocardiales bacterium]
MVVLGVSAAVASAVLGEWQYAPVIGWDVAAVVFVVSLWLAVGRMDPDGTRSHATAEDPSRGATDLIVLLASVFSLVAVAMVLVQAGSTSGAERNALVGLAAGSVVLSWLAIHTLFMLRYARLYYGDTPGGVDFNQTQPPRYIDFAYLAFSLGMTYQVSDTDLQTTEIRSTALRHALLSYLFGAVILATAISLVASLASGS